MILCYKPETNIYTPEQLSILYNQRILFFRSKIEEDNLPFINKFFWQILYESYYYPVQRDGIEKFFFVDTFLPLKGTLVYPVGMLEEYDPSTNEFKINIKAPCKLTDDIHIYTSSSISEISRNCNIKKIRWINTEQKEMFIFNTYYITIDTTIPVGVCDKKIICVLKYII